MANAYQDALRQFATNSQRDQALGRPTQMSSTGLARANPPLPPVTAMPPRPGTPNSPGNKPWNDMITTGQERFGPVASLPPTTSAPVVATGNSWQKPNTPGQPQQNPYQVGWGSSAGQPRPGNAPYAQQPWQPAYGNMQNPYQQQQPWTYPPQMRPQSAYPQTPQQPNPYRYQQPTTQPWQTGNQQAPNVSGMPGWYGQLQQPNYQRQFDPYSLPTQGMVRPMSPGQSYDSFMGAWQNPMAGMIAQQPNWRQSPAMPSIPQIPNMPQYQGPPNPWAQQQEWQRTQQPPGQGKPNPIQMNRPPLQYNPALVQPY